MKRVALIITFGVLVYSLAGCHRPLPICDPARIGYPEIYSLHNYEVVDSLRPTVEWMYLDPACVPESYEVKLQKDEHVPNSHLSTQEIIVDETVSGYVNSWTPSFDLEPVQKYTYSIFVQNASGTSGSSVTFFTGPLCRSKNQLAPILRMPPNGGVVYQNSGGELFFEWEYGGECLPNGFQIQISSDASFAPEAGYFYEIDVPLPNRYAIINAFSGIIPCDTYFWRIRPRLGTVESGEEGPFSAPWSFYLAGEACPLLVPADLGPTLEPIFLVRMGAFCRSGPSTLYAANATVEQGSQLPARGRNADASWFFVRLSDSKTCWISGVVGDLQGDPGLLTEIVPPPLPSPTPTSRPEAQPPGCSQYNANANICIANGCKWDPVGHPNSPCVEK